MMASVNCRQIMPVCFIHPEEELQRSLGVADFERDEILEFHTLCLTLRELLLLIQSVEKDVLGVEVVFNCQESVLVLVESQPCWN